MNGEGTHQPASLQIGLVLDYPTVHGRRRFKALINSGATFSLMHTIMYNMIEDCYKTSVLPTAVHLRTADWSPMSSMGKATLHL